MYESYKTDFLLKKINMRQMSDKEANGPTSSIIIKRKCSKLGKTAHFDYTGGLCFIGNDSCLYLKEAKLILSSKFHK